ncbi:NEAT domain-containing protein [Paenibacillus sp. L3-i20]|uniref:NEAT domain-containing protein n=1 Tax=Paenibacillus sp. L3-i20 TaxID=2905833 RepID=UPI001EE0F628|nr:NEAT domain-containing protein [Paenibacillus sp. L3-i20]GKU76762.1 hypothetical protein L3i20_v211590 [Paenibacillus sp. L3-i20]
MKFSMKKIVAMLLTFAFLLVSLNIGPASATEGAPVVESTPTAEVTEETPAVEQPPVTEKTSSAITASSPVIPNGEYTIPFRYLKDNSDQTSMADKYMIKNTGKLIVNGGNISFQHEITDIVHSTFSFLGLRNKDAAKAIITNVDGVETATGMDGYTVVTSNEAANAANTVISYKIIDPWVKQDLLMFINDPEGKLEGINYVHWYHGHIELNLENIDLTPGENGGGENGNTDVTKEMFDNRVASANTLLQSSNEGETEGTYPDGSKKKLEDAITSALATEQSMPGNKEILKAAYTIVDQAIKKFESQKNVIDTSKLSEWITQMEAWLPEIKDVGTAVPNPERETPVPSRNPDGPQYRHDWIISAEEYPFVEDSSSGDDYKLSSGIKRKITEFKALISDPNKTQAKVNHSFAEANADFGREVNEKKKFVEQSPVAIQVLDTLDNSSVESKYASDFDKTAVILKSASDPYYDMYANITFNDKPDDNINFKQKSIVVSSYNSNTGLPDQNNFYLQPHMFPVNKDGFQEKKVYQAYLKGTVLAPQQTPAAVNNKWGGFFRVTYADASRIVFISFNKSFHDNLNTLITEAQTLHDNAIVGTDLGQYPAHFKTKLQEAITNAQYKTKYLSTPRPQLVSATTELQTAINALKTSVKQNINFSVVHAIEEKLSTMESYFRKPALISTKDDGSLDVTMTILSSDVVKGFKIKQNGTLVDASVVSEDTAAKTKTVTFNVPNVSSFVEAEVLVDVPNRDVDHTYSIRLNFNNVDTSALYKLIQEATTTHEGAKVGIEPGQYLEMSKTAFRSAIDSAHKEAARLNATNETIATAVQSLQRAQTTFKETVIPQKPTGPGPNIPTGPAYPADGYYLMNFTILKEGTESTSVMHGYVFSTALVKVSGGTKTVSFTVKQSAEITGLTLNGSNGVVTENNPNTNTRVVTFTLSDLSSKIPGWVDVYWNLESFIYDHEYTVQYKFNEGSARPAGANPVVPGGSGKVGSPPGLENPGGNNPSPGGGGNPEAVKDKEKDKDKDKEKTEEAQKPNEAVKFNDIEKHWAKSSIEQAASLNILSGYADGSFRPNDKITRGQFAVMISRALMLEGEDTDNVFADSSSTPNWAKAHIARVVAAGIMSGFEDETFRSGEQLTRVQLAIIVARAANLKLEDGAKIDFADAASIPVWAQKEVTAAAKAGLVTGKDNNKFAPNEVATRAEALTIILRLLESFEK